MEIEIVLNQDERAELDHCETIINMGLSTFIKVGEALLTIKDRRLYREDYSTFDDYCRDKWRIASSRARQLMGASETVQDIKSVTTGNTFLPTNERQTRPMARLTPDEKGVAWQRAVKEAEGKHPSGKMVERIVKEINPITKESQTKWVSKSKVSIGGFSQVVAGDDFSQYDPDDTSSIADKYPPNVQQARGLLEQLGWSCIPPEAAGGPNCPYCARAYR